MECKSCYQDKDRQEFVTNKGISNRCLKCRLFNRTLKPPLKICVCCKRELPRGQFLGRTSQKRKCMVCKLKAERRRKEIDRKKAFTKFKRKARQKCRNAVNYGSLIRGNCACCGAGKKIHAHHEDYNKPLEVIWLCSDCHSILHGMDIIKFSHIQKY